MKKTLIILFLVFYNCKSSKNIFLHSSESSLKSLIKKAYLENPEEGNRFLNNEAKFILECRNEFITKSGLNIGKNFSLVEFYDPFSETNYSGVFKDGNNIYYFKRGFELKSQIRKMNFPLFKKDYPVLSCLVVKIDEDLNSLIGKTNGSTFHGEVILTRMESNIVKTYYSRNVCVLE